MLSLTKNQSKGRAKNRGGEGTTYNGLYGEGYLFQASAGT